MLRKSCWVITIPGYKPFTMGGESMTYEEALAAARVIWPDAEVR